jgi:hypothetical protein
VQITNAAGQLVIRKDMRVSETDYKHLASLQKGMYYVKITELLTQASCIQQLAVQLVFSLRQCFDFPDNNVPFLRDVFLFYFLWVFNKENTLVISLVAVTVSVQLSQPFSCLIFSQSFPNAFSQSGFMPNETLDHRIKLVFALSLYKCLAECCIAVLFDHSLKFSHTFRIEILQYVHDNTIAMPCFCSEQIT